VKSLFVQELRGDFISFCPDSGSPGYRGPGEGDSGAGLVSDAETCEVLVNFSIVTRSESARKRVWRVSSLSYGHGIRGVLRLLTGRRLPAILKTGEYYTVFIFYVVLCEY
jgi:hypothetical protein